MNRLINTDILPAEVFIVEESTPLKKFYVEVQMNPAPQAIEITNHETWRELKTHPEKLREFAEKHLNTTLSDDDKVVFKEETAYHVYKAKVHGRNAIIISKSPLSPGKANLSLRRRDDFPIYDEVSLVGDTKYAIYEIAKWLGIRTKDKDGVPLDPEDLWDLFLEKVRDGDVCYEPYTPSYTVKLTKEKFQKLLEDTLHCGFIIDRRLSTLIRAQLIRIPLSLLDYDYQKYNSHAIVIANTKIGKCLSMDHPVVVDDEILWPSAIYDEEGFSKETFTTPTIYLREKRPDRGRCRLYVSYADKLIKVTLENGLTFKGTPEHKVFCRVTHPDEGKTVTKWVSLGEIDLYSRKLYEVAFSPIPIQQPKDVRKYIYELVEREFRRVFRGKRVMTYRELMKLWDRKGNDPEAFRLLHEIYLTEIKMKGLRTVPKPQPLDIAYKTNNRWRVFRIPDPCSRETGTLLAFLYHTTAPDLGSFRITPTFRDKIYRILDKTLAQYSGYTDIRLVGALKIFREAIFGRVDDGGNGIGIIAKLPDPVVEQFLLTLLRISGREGERKMVFRLKSKHQLHQICFLLATRGIFPTKVSGTKLCFNRKEFDQAFNGVKAYTFRRFIKASELRYGRIILNKNVCDKLGLPINDKPYRCNCFIQVKGMNLLLPARLTISSHPVVFISSEYAEEIGEGEHEITIMVKNLPRKLIFKKIVRVEDVPGGQVKDLNVYNPPTHNFIDAYGIIHHNTSMARNVRELFMHKDVKILSKATSAGMVGYISTDKAQGSWVDRKNMPVFIEELQQQAIIRHLLELTEQGEAEIAEAGKTLNTKTLSSFVIFANPEEEVELGDIVGRVLKKISPNFGPISSRFAAILVGKNLERARRRKGVTITPEYLEEARRIVAYVLETQEPFIEKIYRDQKIIEWLEKESEIPDFYKKKLDEYADKARNFQIRQLIRERIGAHRHMKGLALKLAILDRMPFTKYDANERGIILKLAKKYLRKICREIELPSIQQLVEVERTSTYYDWESKFYTYPKYVKPLFVLLGYAAYRGKTVISLAELDKLMKSELRRLPGIKPKDIEEKGLSALRGFKVPPSRTIKPLLIENRVNLSDPERIEIDRSLAECYKAYVLEGQAMDIFMEKAQAKINEIASKYNMEMTGMEINDIIVDKIMEVTDSVIERKLSEKYPSGMVAEIMEVIKNIYPKGEE